MTTLLQTRDDWHRLPVALKFSAVVQRLADEYNQTGQSTTSRFDKARPSWMPKSSSLATMFAVEWREIQALAHVPISGKSRHHADGVALCDCGQPISTARVVHLGGIGEHVPAYTAILPLCDHCAAILDEDEEPQEVPA